MTPSRVLEGNVGYIHIPAFSGSDNRSTKFAEQIQNAINEIDSESIVGWVVDLRNNTGGDFFSMLAGIGPILGEGLAGYFIDPDNISIPWGYTNGAGWRGEINITNLSNAYTLASPNPKVAVLTNQRTASSGEAVTVAFKDRENTKSFGQGTFGVSTSNDIFELLDGAWLVLTVSTFADRNKNLYGSSIDPDEIITADADILEQARVWVIN